MGWAFKVSLLFPRLGALTFHVKYLALLLLLGIVPAIITHRITGSIGWVYAVGSLAYVVWISGFVVPQKLDNELHDTIANLTFLVCMGKILHSSPQYLSKFMLKLGVGCGSSLYSILYSIAGGEA